MFLDMAAFYGSSGGPVYDQHGNVIGLLVGGLDGAGGMTWAIPGKHICHLMGR